MLNHLLASRLCALALVLFSLSACNTLKPSSEEIQSSIDHALPDMEAEALGESAELVDKIAVEAAQPIAAPFTDVWDRIRAGYGLATVDHPQIDKQVSWYSRHQDYIDRFTERSQRYLHYVVSQMEANDMPLELALLPVVESSYNPFAYSRSDAAGIWQFVPGTGRSFGLQQNWWYDGRRDIVASTTAAINYLQRLHDMFDGDWLLALAAYNSGEGRVSRAIEKNRRAGKPTDFWSLSLPRETRAYLPHLLALAKIVATPETYNVTLKSIPNDPYFTKINIDSQIDLMQAARLADVDLKELQTLNAGYNRWLTDPSNSHHILVPVADAANMTSHIEDLPKLPPISWNEHKVARGDVLGSIARRYHTTVNAIKSVNQLRNNTIRIGQILLVPSAAITMSDHATSEQLMRNYGKKIASGRTQYYVVRSGDSLWKIAHRHNTSVSKLTQLNNINKKARLKPGQKLIVTSSQKQSTAKKTVAKNGLQKMIYEIKSGDTIHGIANRFQLSTKQILSWNTVKDARNIRPGQSLTLYVDQADI